MSNDDTLNKLQDLIVHLESSNARQDAQIVAIREDLKSLAGALKDVVESTDATIKSVFSLIGTKDQNNRTRVLMSLAIVVTLVLAAGSGVLLMSNRLRDSITEINESRVQSAYQMGRIDATLENQDKDIRELRSHIFQ